MPETAQYQYGELVDIVIRGARVDHHADGQLYIQVPGAAAGSLIPLGAAVSVTVVQPADGPAQVGDVWRTPAGALWFAYEEMQFGSLALRLTSGELRNYTLSEICESFGSPTLEYRVPASKPEPDPLTIDEPVDPVGTEYIAASGSVWVKRDADLLSPPGVDDPCRWRTRGEVVEMQGELTRVEPIVDPSVFGPCNGLTADSRDNTCTNFAAEYVEYPTKHVPFRDGEVIQGTNLRRLCTPCADAAPGRLSRRPLSTDPNGYPVETAAAVTA